MRATYVNPQHLLTPVGEWIASRMPFTQSIKTKKDRTFRVYVGPRVNKAILTHSVVARGYRVVGFPFKYVYWSIDVELFGFHVYHSRRLFGRHSLTPNLRPNHRRRTM